jgi:hypothetical protein
MVIVIVRTGAGLHQAWFDLQFFSGYRWRSDSLFHEPPKKLSTARGFPTIETKNIFIEVKFKIFIVNRAMKSSQNPSLK